MGFCTSNEVPSIKEDVHSICEPCGVRNKECVRSYSSRAASRIHNPFDNLNAGNVLQNRLLEGRGSMWLRFGQASLFRSDEAGWALQVVPEPALQCRCWSPWTKQQCKEISCWSRFSRLRSSLLPKATETLQSEAAILPEPGWHFYEAAAELRLGKRLIRERDEVLLSPTSSNESSSNLSQKLH